MRVVQLPSDATYLSNLDEKVKHKVSEKQLEVYGYIWIVLIISALILDISCYKYRPIAKVFFPLEMLKLCFVNLVQFEETCQAYHM